MAWSIAFHATGAKFRPSEFNYPFTRAHDTGTIQPWGRHRDEPKLYGSIVIECPNHIPNQDRIIYIVKAAQGLLPDLIRAGATEWYLNIGRFYSTQCNESFSSEELKLMGSLNCDLFNSAYKVSKKEERQLDEKYGGFEVP